MRDKHVILKSSIKLQWIRIFSKVSISVGFDCRLYIYDLDQGDPEKGG